MRVTAALLGTVVSVAGWLAFSPVAHADRVASPWSWTDYGPALRDVACSAPGACVAVGQRGVALRSTRGADAPLAWTEGRLSYPEELEGVTCAPTFCLAVSFTRTAAATYVSKVFRSTDGGASWSSPNPLPAAGAAGTRSAVAVACDPAADSCFAVGPGGGVWRSTDEGRSWRALDLPPTPASYRRVACPAPGTCVAVGGDAAVSSAIVRDGQVTAVELPPTVGKGMLALACDRATRCTATDGLGHVMSMALPQARWERLALLPKATPISDLACPREDVCVGLAESLALRTTDLSAGTWRRRPLGTLNLAALACAETACVAVGKAASWFASLDAGFGWGRVNEVGRFDAITCAAALAGGCVAGGEKDLGVSPGGGALWALPLSGYAGLDVRSLRCAEPSRCLVLGKTLTLATDDLLGFAARHPTIVDPKGTDALSCVTQELCVGLNEGVVYTTLDGAVTDWTHSGFPDKATSVACIEGRADPVTCVATTRDFLMLGTMTIADGHVRWRWAYTDADPSEGLEAVACSPGGQCTAVGGGGTVLTSQGTDLMSWTELIVPDELEPVETRPLLKSAACPADGVCLAGGVHGPDAVIASTTNGWADFAFDEIEGIEGAAPTIKAFGCASAERCVAVGSTALIGTAAGGRR